MRGEERKRRNGALQSARRTELVVNGVAEVGLRTAIDLSGPGVGVVDGDNVCK